MLQKTVLQKHTDKTSSVRTIDMTSWVHSTTTACSGDFVHTNTASAHMVAAQIQFEKKKLKLPQRVCMCLRCCALNDPSRMKVKAINCPYLWREVIHRDFMMKTGRRGHRERKQWAVCFFSFLHWFSHYVSLRSISCVCSVCYARQKICFSYHQKGKHANTTQRSQRFELLLVYGRIIFKKKT